MKQLKAITNSYELFGLINEHRVMAGKTPIGKHAELVRKMQDELEDLQGRKKITLQYSLPNGGTSTFEAYVLSEEDVMLTAMRESKQVRKSVYRYIKALEKENSKLLDIVYDVITNKAFLGQEFGLKCAGIERPRKFMQFFKTSVVGIDWLIEHGYFSYRQVGAKSTDRCWCWSQEGFQWLLKNSNKLNIRVDQLMAA